MAALGNVLQQTGLRHQPRQLRGKTGGRIVAAMVEYETACPIFDIVVKAAQVRHDDGAARGHGLQRRQSQCLARFGETGIDEDRG